MASKNTKTKREKADKDSAIEKPSLIAERTKHIIIAIVLAVCSIFLFLSPQGNTGPVGRVVYQFLHYLFGGGYYLVPIVCALLCVSFFRSIRPKLMGRNVIGGSLFLLSGLGLADVSFSENAGGIVGHGIAYALVSLFASAVSQIILGAVLLISLIVIFDSSFPLAGYLPKLAFWKRDTTTNDTQEEDETEDQQSIETVETQATERAVPQEEAPKEERKIMQKLGGMISFDKEDETFRGLISATPYAPPPLSLLSREVGKPSAGDIKANANIIKRTLSNFGIEVEMDEVTIGPSITRYALKPAEGVKLSKIVGLQNDLSLALAAHPLRIEAPIPGKSLVGIEIPNTIKTTVRLGSLLGEDSFNKSAKALMVTLGKAISGQSHFADLAKMPHILIAGTTGSGKSVTIHAFIISLLYRNSPDNLRFIMVDPKRVELTLYNKIPHLLTPVITDAKKTIQALKWAGKEMDRRYDILQAESVRDIDSYHTNVYQPALEEYNKKRAAGVSPEEEEKLRGALPEPMPYIAIFIDELADVMSTYPREMEAAVVRLAQMSRAVGIHLILSTQRPSTEVITGLIKANVPARVALQVPSQIDSRTIIDMPGAEKLLGSGDMLFLSGEMSKPSRIQSAYISESEVKKVVEYLVNAYKDELPTEVNITGQTGQSDSLTSVSFDDGPSDDDDELYEEAKQTVLSMGKASTSLLQRKLKVGYARAARLLDMLEERGVVGAGDGAKPREVFGASASSGGMGGGGAVDAYARELAHAEKMIEKEEELLAEEQHDDTVA